MKREMSNSDLVNESGHPKGLYVLFGAEMWERFSYYGMRALLVLYMTDHMSFSDDAAYGVYGAYTALVYATPVFGGMIADKILGFRKAVMLGGTLMALGHFAMAMESMLYVALAFLIVGNGFFKPNISSIVGKLYKKGDPRRDAGFTIFYMGINLGAFLSPIVCGWLGQEVGWHWGFGLAGIGMIIGLVNFALGSHRFAGLAEPPATDNHSVQVRNQWLVYIGAFLAVGVAWFLVRQTELVGYMLNGFGIFVLAALVAYMISKCSSDERRALIVALVLTAYSVLFWSFFEQAGSSLNLFTERNVNKSFFGWFEIPASVFQAVNAGFIVLLAPVFSMLWRGLAARGREPSTPVKFGLALIQLGLGFVALWAGAILFSEAGVVALGWLILGYLLHTTGELCLSPVGLSMITRLSPMRIVGLMMGVWFLASAYAQYVAAGIARLMSIVGAEGGEGGVLEKEAMVQVYGNGFGQIALFAIGGGFVMLIVSPILNRILKSRTESS